MLKYILKKYAFKWNYQSDVTTHRDSKKNWKSNILTFIYFVFSNMQKKRISTKKYVLCRPRGGLNDMLCQIEACYQYCIKHNRFLIVDSPFINSNFFKLKKKYLTNISLNFNSELYDSLKTLSVFPTELQNRIKTYEVYFKSPFFRDKKTKVPIFFNFHKDYKEDILIYEQWGGGKNSINFLKKILLQKNILKEINLRFKNLPNNYISIHIRNTDYKTDYENYYNSIKEEVRGKNILICTDDNNCIEYTKKFFNDSNVFTISKNIIPNLQAELKKGKESKYIYELNLDRIADLLAMALSKKIYHTKCYTILANGNRKNITSGFTSLAENLQKENHLKKKLLNKKLL